MYYLGWQITYEKAKKKLQFVARRSFYKDIYEMNLNKLYGRIEYAENQIGREEQILRGEELYVQSVEEV